MIRANLLVGAAFTLAMATAAWPVRAVEDPKSVPGHRRTVTLDELLWGTRLCMREAVRTQLVQGVRGSGEIVTFALSVCGDGLTAFMRTNLQRPAAEAAMFVEGIAYEELDRFPGIVRAGSPAISERQRGASDVYVVTTFKNKQPIDVRRTEVAELLDAGIATISALRKATPSPEKLASAARDMAEKDRCFNLHSSMVALASIEAGTIDATPGIKQLLRSSIASIEAANNLAQIVCEMR